MEHDLALPLPAQTEAFLIVMSAIVVGLLPGSSPVRSIVGLPLMDRKEERAYRGLLPLLSPEAVAKSKLPLRLLIVGVVGSSVGSVLTGVPIQRKFGLCESAACGEKENGTPRKTKKGVGKEMENGKCEVLRINRGDMAARKSAQTKESKYKRL